MSDLSSIEDLERKMDRVFSQLNRMATTVTKTITMVDNVRLINIELIKRIELLEKAMKRKYLPDNSVN